MASRPEHSPVVVRILSKRARVAVWGDYWGTDLTKTHLISPCKTEGFSRWGCARFMEHQGISEVKIAKYASRDSGLVPPVSQIEPAEVRAEGVPLTELYDVTDFDNRLDPD